MNVNFDFDGKNFVVVGASSGIGKQTAIELATGGANVLAIGRNVERLDELKNICPEKIFTVSLDVIDAESADWTQALTKFIDAVGKVDGGVYSAGIVGLTPLAGDFGTKSLFAYSAAKAAVKAAVKPIAKEIIRNRHRVNTVSPAMVKTDMLGNIAYESEIGAAEMSRYLLGLGKPDDISGLILFLLSDRAGWITGQDFALDGGYLLSM